MATKKHIELSGYSSEDLMNELNETQAQYLKMKYDNSIKGLENPLLLREVRRDIARLNTEVRRREVIALTPDQLQKRSKLRARRK